MIGLLHGGSRCCRARTARPAHGSRHSWRSTRSTVPDAERHERADRALAMARRVGDNVALTSVLSAHSWTAMGPSARAAPPVEGHLFRFIALVRARGADAATRRDPRQPIADWAVLEWESIQALLAGRLADAEELAVQSTEAARAGAPASIVEFSSIALLWCRAGVMIAQAGPVDRATGLLAHTRGEGRAPASGRGTSASGRTRAYLAIAR